MYYCHQNSLIHRDQKLENLLLVNTEQKKIKIIDFGIAGVVNNFKLEEIDTGSLNYMAPECFYPMKDRNIDGLMFGPWESSSMECSWVNCLSRVPPASRKLSK
jgi:serine/threonine protein kinase